MEYRQRDLCLRKSKSLCFLSSQSLHDTNHMKIQKPEFGAKSSVSSGCCFSTTQRGQASARPGGGAPCARVWSSLQKLLWGCQPRLRARQLLYVSDKKCAVGPTGSKLLSSSSRGKVSGLLPPCVLSKPGPEVIPVLLPMTTPSLCTAWYAL